MRARGAQAVRSAEGGNDSAERGRPPARRGSRLRLVPAVDGSGKLIAQRRHGWNSVRFAAPPDCRYGQNPDRQPDRSRNRMPRSERISATG
jgi:hypothetical protein